MSKSSRFSCDQTSVFVGAHSLVNGVVVIESRVAEENQIVASQPLPRMLCFNFSQLLSLTQSSFRTFVFRRLSESDSQEESVDSLLASNAKFRRLKFHNDGFASGLGSLPVVRNPLARCWLSKRRHSDA